MKADVMTKGAYNRFLVTTRTDSVPTAIYDWCVDRGETENWIKDLKAERFAHRLSCHRFWAN